jgi:hypothetical protein
MHGKTGLQIAQGAAGNPLNVGSAYKLAGTRLQNRSHINTQLLTCLDYSRKP